MQANKNHLYLILLLLLNAAAITINIYLKLPPENILLFVTGGLFYFLFLKINRIHLKYECDYIQSGEGLSGILMIIIAARFISSNIYIILVFTIVSVIFIEVFLNDIIQQNNKEAFIYGVYTNIIISILMLYFIQRDIDFTAQYLPAAVTGYAGVTDISAYQLLGAGLIFLIIFTSLLLIKPELSLFSHGLNYFSISELNFNKLKRTAIIMRGIVFTFLIFTIGLAGGTGNYFQWDRKNRSSQIILILFLVLYSQILILISLLTGPFIAASFSLLLSYIFYYYSKRKKVYLYDRNY